MNVCELFEVAAGRRPTGVRLSFGDDIKVDSGLDTS